MQALDSFILSLKSTLGKVSSCMGMHYRNNLTLFMTHYFRTSRSIWSLWGGRCVQACRHGDVQTCSGPVRKSVGSYCNDIFWSSLGCFGGSWELRRSSRSGRGRVASLAHVHLYGRMSLWRHTTSLPWSTIDMKKKKAARHSGYNGSTKTVNADCVENYLYPGVRRDDVRQGGLA